MLVNVLPGSASEKGDCPALLCKASAYLLENWNTNTKARIITRIILVYLSLHYGEVISDGNNMISLESLNCRASNSHLRQRHHTELKAFCPSHISDHTFVSAFNS